tara:strand:- start:3771 stop:4232 length:462 start_codon:yes stop_codon:yes gene_type:complete
MAIGTDATIEFFGTLDDLDSASAAVANDAFSISTDVVTPWTNDDDAPLATMVFIGTWTSAPTANTVVNLYARLLNVADTTKDQDVPDSNFGHAYLGSFPLNDVTTEQIIAIQIALPNVKSSTEYEFYIENRSGQTIDSGWSLQITPKTLGPSA